MSRRTLATLLSLAIAPAALPACGGEADADVYGVYAVTRHSHAQAVTADQPIACGTEGPAEADPAFVALVDELGSVNLQTCTGPELATCTFTLVSFDLDGSSLASEHSNTQVGGGTDCALYHSEYRGTYDDGAGALHLEIREWIVYPDPAPLDCALELAEALTDADDCYEVEVYDAERVSP